MSDYLRSVSRRKEYDRRQDHRTYHFLQIPGRDCPEPHRVSLHIDQGGTWHISPRRERIRNPAELVRKDEPSRARNRNWNRRPWRVIPAGPTTLLRVQDPTLEIHELGCNSTQCN